MNRWGYLGLVILAIAGGYFIYQHEQTIAPSKTSGPGTVPLHGAAPKPVDIVWQKVDRTMNGFQIEMPGNAKQIKIPAYNEHGGSEQADMLYAYPDAQICFSITWAENPPVERINQHVPDHTLDMAVMDALDRSQTTLITKSDVSQQGFPARNFSARNTGGGVFYSRLVLVRHRLYMLTAAFPSIEARRDPDVSHFFNSFSVIDSSKNN